MTTLIDALGHPVSGATGAAIDHYEQAAHELRCLIGDPLATIDRAIAAAPGMSIAHTLRAWLHPWAPRRRRCRPHAMRPRWRRGMRAPSASKCMRMPRRSSPPVVSWPIA